MIYKDTCSFLTTGGTTQTYPSQQEEVPKGEIFQKENDFLSLCLFLYTHTYIINQENLTVF